MELILKKLGLYVAILFVITLGIGLECKGTYTHIDIGNEKMLEKYGFKVGYCDATEFAMEGEEELDEEWEQQEQVEDENINEEGQYVDDAGNVIEDMSEDSGESKMDGDFGIHNTEKNSESTQYDVTTAWMEYIDLDTETAMREVLDDAQYVVIATATGNVRSLGGTLQQEICVKKVLKGAVEWNGKNIKVLSTMENTISKTGGSINGWVNLMKEGKRYLVFLNEMNFKGEKYETMAYLADSSFVPYFCLDEMETKVVSTNDEGEMYYKDVKNYEFFVADDSALQKLLVLKEEYVNKYVTEN